MLYSIPRVVIAGLKGGTGKTTLSLGVLSLLRKKGLTIVPFKKGPDYIDAGWLAKASGQECHNLDAFLMPEQEVIRSFLSNAQASDGALIEGNRGLFDGMDEQGTFSTARLGTSLSAPVVLVVDCTKVTATLAAIVQGVVAFDRDVVIGGVVLNQLAGLRHEQVIRRALETHTDVRVIGAVRRLRHDIIGERHLGLIPYQESDNVHELLKRTEEVIRDSVDTESVLSVMETAPPLESELDVGAKRAPGEKTVKIGIMKDSAFQFYYPENVMVLDEKGAEVVEINALQEERLPDIHALYIGGGFPETHAISLSKNRILLKDIKERAEQGLPVYAECGGLMFLGQELEVDHAAVQMVGLLPLRFTMKKKPVAHGYTIVEVVHENPYFKVGTELKGHEFHYSEVIGIEGVQDLRLVFLMKRGKGIKDSHDGIIYKNVFATYTHLHALGSPQWADAMIRVARKYKESL